ncbi:MAG: hypothetical protein CMF48_00775 [Legionellales bacterium]|nr:hypothetical protein [Legionellales bacterium]|tara:strand:- start:520 stop:741 length:222 start_codon:yes stop_codon:yes gene_type:complete
MKELTGQECQQIVGGSFVGVITNAAIGTVVGSVVGFCTGGPPGAAVGALNGAVNSTGMSLIKEGGSRLYEIFR